MNTRPLSVFQKMVLHKQNQVNKKKKSDQNFWCIDCAFILKFSLIFWHY